jgi:hypothetical protein
VETDRSSPLIVGGGLPNQPDPRVVGSIYITPLLSTSLPDTVYHVYKETEERYNGLWIFLEIKGEDKVTYYTLAAFKRYGFQIPNITLSRTAEYGVNCVVAEIEPIEPIPNYGSSYASYRSNALANGNLGRPMTFRTTAVQEPITETLDRTIERKNWYPRRFTYGNRRFIWRSEALYEVEKEWADPESKTNKILDQTFGRALLTSKPKVARKKICTVNIAGGLDQQFREYLLASYLIPKIIHEHGHFS